MVVACAAIAACETVPDKQYHRTPPAGESLSSVTMHMRLHGWGAEPVASPSSKRRPATFDKAYLEFREDGEMFDPAQKQLILDKLASYKDTRRPIFLVTYTHGWHHNAYEPKPGELKPDDDPLGYNAVKFDYIMARYVEHVRRHFELSDAPDAPIVLGVYIGWRGERLKGSLSSVFTLDDRAQTADNIAANGTQGGLKQTLSDFSRQIEAIHPGSRMLVTGHSLGGRMLAMMSLKDIADGNTYPLGGNALIFALEPAIGAECFDDVFKPDLRRQPGTLPGLIAMTSEHDTAISAIYSLATHIRVVAPPVCSRTSPARGRTIGNYAAYITHDLRFEHVADKKAGHALEPVKGQEIFKPDGSLLYPVVGSDNTSWMFGSGNTFWRYPYFDITSQKYNLDDYILYRMTLTHGLAYRVDGAVWNVRIDENLIDVGAKASNTRDSIKPGSIGAHHNGIASTGVADILGRIVFMQMNGTVMAGNTTPGR